LRRTVAQPITIDPELDVTVSKICEKLNRCHC
jgi:hypothetical protein